MQRTSLWGGVCLGLAAVGRAVAAGSSDVPRPWAGMAGWAEVTLNRTPVDPADPWATVARSEVVGVPCSVLVRYQWGRSGDVSVEAPAAVFRTAAVFGVKLLRRSLRLQGGLIRQGNPPREADIEWLAREWPDMNRKRPPAGPFGYLGFYLVRLWVAAHASRPVVEDNGLAESDGRPVRTYDVLFREPIEIYQGHTLKSFVIEIDDATKAPVRYAAYEPDGRLAVQAHFSEFTEVAPGRWAALRIEEQWHAGLIKWVIPVLQLGGLRQPDREYQRWAQTAVPAAREVSELAVVGEGIVAPKEISRYDDQGRLLMHMEFLSYEIEYEDGTVVYAEP